MKIVILCGAGFKVIRGNKIKAKTNGKNWKYAYLNAYYKIL